MTPARRRPSGRASSAVAAALVAVGAACSGATGGQVGADITTAPSTYEQAVSRSAASAKLEAPLEPATMALQATVSVTVGESAASLSVDAAETGEPFGRFAACSGWQSSVAAYGVSVRDPAGGDVGAISVLTDHPVSGPGTHQAVIRLETADGPVMALGTMQLDEGLRAGSFTGFNAEGVPVSGRFACAGAQADPVPVTDDTEAVEVAVYLRSAESEEVVGLVARPADAEAVDCGEPDGTVVHVEGDASLGAVTQLELASTPVPLLRLQVGAVTYDVQDVTIDLAADGTAGTFAGTADGGVAVDGAFRCR